jgi:hypothetical protein
MSVCFLERSKSVGQRAWGPSGGQRAWGPSGACRKVGLLCPMATTICRTGRVQAKETGTEGARLSRRGDTLMQA